MSEQAKQRALKWVARKARTEQEVRRYLEQSELPFEVIEEVVAYLYSYKYLDDRALAGMYVRDRIRFHPCGREKMRYEMQQKGLTDEDIEAAFAEDFPDEVECALATEMLSQQLARGRSLQQAQRYLYGKGFGGDVIAQAVHRD